MSGHERQRLGVAGLGGVAQAVYLPLLARNRERFEITAVSDLSPTLRDAIGDAHGVPPSRRYADTEGMLDAGGMDGVALLTSGSHGASAAAALNRGLAVLCEKPLACTLAEVDALAEATAGARAPQLQLGYMKQHDPAVRQCAELLSDVDGLRSIEISVLHPSTESQLAFANIVRADDVDLEHAAVAAARERDLARHALGPVPEHVEQLYSQVVLGSIVHDLYLMRMLVGSPQRVDFVRSWPDGSFPPSVEICGSLRAGVRFAIRWHYLENYPTYEETLQFHHAHGSLRLTFPSPYLLNAPTELTVVDGSGEAERRTVYRSTSEAFEEQLLTFHAMTTAGVPPLSSVPEGREDIGTCQRIMRRYGELAGIPIGGEAAIA